MGYENPRDRLELFLKKIIDKSTAPAERRTRFEQFLAGILDGSLVPDDPRNRLELYLKGVAESGGYIPPSGTITITANGIHTVEQYKYADVQVPAGGPATDQLALTLSQSAVAGTYTPPAGYVYDQVTITQDSTVIKPENIKKDVSILGVTGSYDVGGILRYDSRQLGCTGSHTVNLGWRPDHIIVSYAYKDPYYDPSDPDQDEIINYHLDLTQTTDITGEDDYVTFTSNGYTFVSTGTGFNDYPEAYSKLTFTAMSVS